MGVAHGRRVEVEAEAVGPAVSGVGLLGAREVGQVVVLHAGEMPDEPGYGVAPFAASAERSYRELVLTEPVDAARHEVVDAVEQIGQYFRDVHALTVGAPSARHDLRRRGDSAGSRRTTWLNQTFLTKLREGHV